MATDIYVSKGLSANSLEYLAKATRTLCDLSDHDHFDIIRFLEIDILKIMPEFYLFIEADEEMNGSKAFVTEDSTAIVVAESVYNDACAGLFYAKKILAHEFGHILIHHNRGYETKHFTFEGYRKQISKMDTFNSGEWQADTFAILLLIPTDAYAKFTAMADFKKKYKMSERQASFISSRLESIKKRNGHFNRDIVQGILNSFQKKRNHSSKSEIQLSFFL